MPTIVNRSRELRRGDAPCGVVGSHRVHHVDDVVRQLRPSSCGMGRIAVNDVPHHFYGARRGPGNPGEQAHSLASHVVSELWSCCGLRGRVEQSLGRVRQTQVWQERSQRNWRGVFCGTQNLRALLRHTGFNCKWGRG